MTPLPPPLGAGELVFWRLDQRRHRQSWDSGEGSYRVGGRWSTRGVRAVYAALDPATAMLEVAVHTTFGSLDSVPHVLTRARIVNPAKVHIVRPDDVPNPNWLCPGAVSASQQAFGRDRLRAHMVILVPSVISVHSWNVVFDAGAAHGLYADVVQESFALDTRLHPPDLQT